MVNRRTRGMKAEIVKDVRVEIRKEKFAKNLADLAVQLEKNLLNWTNESIEGVFLRSQIYFQKYEKIKLSVNLMRVPISNFL